MPAQDSRARRSFLKATARTGLAGGLAGGLADTDGQTLAQAFDWKPQQRYPDPAVQILDPSFTKYRIYSSTLEQVATGMRWAEGPVYLPETVAGAGGHLLVSDIPNNRIMKYSEKDGALGDAPHHAHRARRQDHRAGRRAGRAAATPCARGLDGVMVFNPQGKPLARIRLPERCANLCFGGPKNNRLYRASCHSLYALLVESHGAA